MPTRAEMLLEPLSRDSRIIEIGPSFSPIAPKSAGWDTAVIDHLPQEGLIATYTGHPGADVSRIEPVDFVWTGGPLSDAVPSAQHGSFDAFIASHVIEHTPDMIAFLDSASVLLKPDGMVILAIPDKRYCFDYFQPLTTTGQLLEAHAERRSRHTRRLAFDHFAYGVEDGGIVAWFQRPIQGLCFSHGLRNARGKFDSFEASRDYVDLHAWRFVPPSFELLLLELARLEQTDWQVERVTQAQGCEFFAWLRRGGAAVAAAMTDEELDATRMELLKRTLLETQPQIDWLLAGDPGSRAELQRLRAANGEAAALKPGADGREQREAERDSAALHAELAQARAAQLAASAQLDAVLHSATWQATRPLRRLAEAMPAPARGAIRRLLRTSR